MIHPFCRLSVTLPPNSDKIAYFNKNEMNNG